MNISAILFIFTLIIFLWYTFKKNKIVNNKSEFTVAGRTLSSFSVSAIIIGTLVGGASTIGTAQIAYEYGAASLIFTFSSAFACFILAIFFSKKLRESETVTVVELIGRYFNNALRKYLGIFALLGLFLQTVAQFLAASSVVMSNLNTSNLISVIITGFFIIFFIVLYGTKGASFLGKYKLIMLYFIGIWSIIIIFSDKFSFSGRLFLKTYGLERGVIDIFSTVLGVLSTQTYLQAIFSAKDIKSARNGAVLSALLIPPVGVMFYLIGAYMYEKNPGIAMTSAVLPIFIKDHFSVYISPVFLAFLFIISVGTASGLFLGTLTVLFEDYLKPLFNVKKIMGYYRLTGLLLILFAVVLTLSGVKKGILEWSYLSMGLRGSAIFLPLISIIFNIRKKKAMFLIFYAMPVCYILFILIKNF